MDNCIEESIPDIADKLSKAKGALNIIATVFESVYNDFCNSADEETQLEKAFEFMQTLENHVDALKFVHDAINFAYEETHNFLNAVCDATEYDGIRGEADYILEFEGERKNV